MSTVKLDCFDVNSVGKFHGDMISISLVNILPFSRQWLSVVLNKSLKA